MKDEKTLRVAIIGAGNVAQKAHLPFFKTYPHPVEIVALCGRDSERTKGVTSTFAIKNSFTDVDEMLQACEPDIVSVCSPNNLHFTHVMLCLDAGCHVFCEKPPAISYEQAKKMEEAAEKKGLLLAYNFQTRQLAEVELVKKYINEDFFGKIYHIKASYLRRRGIPGWGNFINKEVQGGGALIDIGIHVLDLALHLLSYPSLKAALASTYDYIGKQGGTGQFGDWNGSNFTVEDACFAHLQLESNCSITLETSFALHTEKQRQFSLEIFGEKGGAVFPPLKLFSEKDGEYIDTVCEYVPAENTSEKNLHAFLNTVCGEKTNICTASEGAQLQRIVEAIYDSANNKT